MLLGITADLRLARKEIKLKWKLREKGSILMPLELTIALIIILPIIILFAVFVWYLNFGRLYATVKETRHKKQSITGSEKPATGRV
jgi:flagellar biosynthesis protein FlhB